jgi:tetratricopeptide (TPR) repeat protein
MKMERITATLTAVEYFNRGRTFLNEDKYDEAILEFEKALATDIGLLRHVRHHTLMHKSIAHTRRGQLYLDKGNYDQAIADFTAVLSYIPNSHEALFGRGCAYHLKNEFERAIEDYTAVLMLCPENTEIREKLKEAISCNSAEKSFENE